MPWGDVLLIFLPFLQGISLACFAGCKSGVLQSISASQLVQNASGGSFSALLPCLTLSFHFRKNSCLSLCGGFTCFRGKSLASFTPALVYCPQVLVKTSEKVIKDGWRPAPWPGFLGILICLASLWRAITSLLGVQLFSPYPIYHCSSSCSSARDKISGKFLLSSKRIHAFWNLVHLDLSVSWAHWRVFKNWFCSLSGFLLLLFRWKWHSVVIFYFWIGYGILH